MSDTIRLTQFSKGSGCGCKIAPAVLNDIISRVRTSSEYPGLLVGNDSNDDAAIIELPGGQCLVSTTDFFAPVVDDAFSFGQIAAVNALSDIYAMGGRPILAIAILGWPVDKLPAALASQVLDGGRSICELAGIPLAGGHSIDAPEPFFGLAVNGIVDRNQIKRNNTLRENDLLFLTKPIGAGMISAAQKRGIATEEQLTDALRWMTTLNEVGIDLATMEGVHAMTDVTGFGLLGHLREMIGSAQLTAEIEIAQVPLMGGVDELIRQMVYPDMTMKTYSAFSSEVNPLDLHKLLVSCDPQTSGGLLIALDPSAAEAFHSIMKQHDLDEIVLRPIGRVSSRKATPVQIN